jgi:hypothetical protein
LHGRWTENNFFLGYKRNPVGSHFFGHDFPVKKCNLKDFHITSTKHKPCRKYDRSQMEVIKFVVCEVQEILSASFNDKNCK